FRTSRTQKFSYSFFQPSRTSTRWWYEVASGGREQYRLVRGGWHYLPAGTSWLAEVSGWYEMTGRNFRLVTRWPAEISILEGAKGERQAGCPDEVRLEERLAGD
ncbi:hypothetical protein DAPPUDRAFT_123295, partial [Daphnia pulex]